MRGSVEPCGDFLCGALDEGGELAAVDHRHALHRGYEREGTDHRTVGLVQRHGKRRELGFEFTVREVMAVLSTLLQPDPQGRSLLLER